MVNFELKGIWKEDIEP